METGERPLHRPPDELHPFVPTYAFGATRTWAGANRRMETIEVSVGDIQAELHEQFEAEAGEQYRERIRQAVEDEIMGLYREQERAAARDDSSDPE